MADFGMQGPPAPPDPGLAPDAPSDGDDDASLRRSRTFASFGFLLLATAVLLPWWTIRLDSEGDEVNRVDLHLWDEHRLVRESTLWTAAGLVGFAVVLLFVRVAAASWKHEPDSWRRDLLIVCALVLVALVLAFFFPAPGEPAFWKTTRATVDGVRYVERSQPGLGWWCGVVSFVLFALGAWSSRSRRA